MKIGDKLIGTSQTPLIVAEMSGNHNQSLERALSIVDAAARAGAHALKLQTYTADTMTIDHKSAEFMIEGSSLWKGRSLYDLYREAHTPWEWHKPIMDRCRKLGVVCFSTPFDESAIEFLEELDSPAYKIASFEITDLDLIRKVSATGKPVIISTGMANVFEIAEAVDAARSAGCKDLVLLKCTSAYPADAAEANIATIPHLKQLFECEVGLSDHTLGIGVAMGAIALGAVLVEKHFTLDRSAGGVDAAFSLEPEELKSLVAESERVFRSIGRVQYGPNESEKESLKYRRSLYVVQKIKKGDVISKENVRAIRPGFGLEPKYFEKVLGRTLKADVAAGTPLGWDLLV